MHESNINQQNIGAALDAVKERHSRGELIGDQSISLTSALRQRLPDLRELNKKHSASAIASALTQEGFTVSASTVQRVLQGTPAKTRKPRTAKETDVTKVVKAISSAPVAAQQKMTDAEALLKQMCQEDNNTTQETENKRIATLK